MRRRACEAMVIPIAVIIAIAWSVFCFIGGITAASEAEQRTAVKEGRARWVADENGYAVFEWCKRECEGSK